MNNILLNLNYLQTRTAEAKRLRSEIEGRLEGYAEALSTQQKLLSVVDLSTEFYKKAIDIVYEKSILELQKTLNKALEYIFYDKKYTIEVLLENKRGKSISFLLTDCSVEHPVQVNIADGVGGGIRAVISFIIHFYYVYHRSKVPMMFIDEQYSQISQDYIDRFFSFIKSLCEAKGLIFVLISHDLARVKDYADKIYRVMDGRVMEVVD